MFSKLMAARVKPVLFLLSVAVVVTISARPASAIQSNLIGLGLLHEREPYPIDQQCQPGAAESACWLTAETARLRNDKAAAKQGYTYLIGRNQRQSLVFYRLGQLYWQADKEQIAIEFWQDEMVREMFVTLCQESARDSNLADRLLTDCQLAVRVYPESPHAWYGLALAHERADRIPEAITAYEAALKLSSEPEIRWVRRAASLYLRFDNRPDDVVILLLPYADQIPPDPNVHQLLGRAYFTLEAYDLSAYHLFIAITNRPQSLAAEHVWYADALYALGRLNEAESHYRQALELDEPGNHMYQRAMRAIQRIHQESQESE